MRKYRIIEKHEGFYPQERACFLCNWKCIDCSIVSVTWSGSYKTFSRVSSYENAVRVIERRKEYLQEIKFKKIHNL